MTDTNAVTNSAIPMPAPLTYLSLGLVACATLVFEIVITRIFSVTMWYHYAFLAISLAMFGLTAGALLMWWKPPRDVNSMLAKSAAGFSLAILAAFFYHAYLPANPMNASGPGQKALFLLCLYLVFALPFVLGGICVCLALTRFPAHTNRLYAADLIGAALGCLLVIYLIDSSDGPTTVVFAALLAAAAAMGFSYKSGRPRLAVACALWCLAVAVGFAACTGACYVGSPLLKIGWVKGTREGGSLYEKWNSFSRVTVQGDPQQAGYPAGWGLSSAYTNRPKIHQLNIQIDASAGTVLTEYHGDPAPLEHLRYDIVNMAHYLRHQARVLVIGAGGGRDVLSALAFNQKSVTGIEINQDILTAVNEVFGEYTGPLNQVPGVTLVNDEARSYIARSREKYDIIQASLIDTYAASAAGAFVLAEHSLYTKEAWSLFLQHLTPQGILTFSRWYYLEGKIAPEIFRAIALARESLLAAGAQDPWQHILLLKPKYNRSNTVCTLLICQSPFTPTDLETFVNVCRALQYEVVIAPGFASHPVWEKILKGESPEQLESGLENMDFSAPTDDRPFYFWVAKPRKLAQSNLFNLNPSPESTLVTALWIVTLLSTGCFVIPFLVIVRRLREAPAMALAGYFAAIGCSFMLIEIAQMQRLVIFLGHPTHGLSVILFTLLLSSGLGSYVAGRLPRGKEWLALAGLMGIVALAGGLSPLVCHRFEGQEFGVRLLLAAALVMPAGFTMGFPFPLGMRWASPSMATATAWLWGMNGAASVCASIVGVLISILWGISATYWTGLFCYVVAGGLLLGGMRRPTAQPAIS